jgi:probable F420-dependent oxidoreductase
MQYGFTVPSRGPLSTPDSLRAIVQRGEELGYDFITTGDHILVPNNIVSPYPYTETGEFPGSAAGSSMDQLTLLSYLAGQTSKIRLSTGVMIVPHRNPLVAAKALTTIDVLSQGRLVVGIGAGWMREEFDALGIPDFDQRGAVTDEYIRAMKELWTSDNPEFDGEYVRFSDISFLPQPVQKPHPPIWVGGESRRAMRRAARYCDGWYPIDANPQFPMTTPEELKAGIDRVAGYAERAERDPAEIEIIYRTHKYELTRQGIPSSQERPLFVGSGEQVGGDIRKFQDLGVGYMVVDFARHSQNLEDMLGHLEDMTTEVWPNV